MRIIPTSLQVLIDDPIVRLMMAADRVVEGEMLVVLSRACDRVRDAGTPGEEPGGHDIGGCLDGLPSAFVAPASDGASAIGVEP